MRKDDSDRRRKLEDRPLPMPSLSPQSSPKQSLPQRAEGGEQLFFLRMPDLKERTRLSQSMIYELMKAQENPFPRPYRLSQRCIAWLESEVNVWLRARVEQGPATPAGALSKPERKRRARAA